MLVWSETQNSWCHFHFMNWPIDQRHTSYRQHQLDRNLWNYLGRHQARTTVFLPILVLYWNQRGPLHKLYFFNLIRCGSHVEGNQTDARNLPQKCLRLTATQSNSALNDSAIWTTSWRGRLPPPRIVNTLTRLHYAKCFSLIDLKIGYWQIEVGERRKRRRPPSRRNTSMSNK